MILGPTATGKSGLAIEAAKTLNGEIISADSMQVYRGMDIGTDKARPEDRRGVPHHLLDIVDPDEPWTVSDFIGRSNGLIKSILKRKKLPIIAGGTGLYLKSLLEGFSLPIAGPNQALRARLEKLSAKSLRKKLVEADPEAAGKISENDRKRTIRALEVFETTGSPISKLQKRSSIEKEYKVIKIGLNMKREKLYERINERVDSMIRKGLVDEVRDLASRGYGLRLTSMQALGYKEIIGHLAGTDSLEGSIELIKKRTRNFARRQMTWFRRFSNVEWFDVTKGLDREAIISHIRKNL